MTSHLEALARRADDDPFFLGCTLRYYARSEDLDDAGVAAALGCTLETLTMLRLCRTPETATCVEDVERIAAQFPVNRDALVHAVRRGQAILHVKMATSGHGRLMAARDADESRPQKPGGDA